MQSITIEDKLNFNVHIKFCLKFAKGFSGNKGKEYQIKSFAVSNFNYCALVWMLANAKSAHKTEAIQKRALCFMLSNYESSLKDLWKGSGKPSMNLRRTKTFCILLCFCIETYKIINNLKS